VRSGSGNGRPLQSAEVERLLTGIGRLEAGALGEADTCVLSLLPGGVLGDAIAALAAANVQVLACHEERSEIEDAFLRLTGAEGEARS
jgi:hypothetical protein